MAAANISIPFNYSYADKHTRFRLLNRRRSMRAVNRSTDTAAETCFGKHAAINCTIDAVITTGERYARAKADDVAISETPHGHCSMAIVADSPHLGAIATTTTTTEQRTNGI